MPPKKDDKKQIVAVLKPGPFWQYLQFDAQQLEKVDIFLATFTNQLKLVVDQEKTIEQNFEVLCDKIGSCVHPCLTPIQKEKSNFPELRNNDINDKKIMMVSHKVDAVTLKLLTWLLSVYKVHCIKFSNNSCQKQALQIKKLFQKQESVSMVFFQWNPLLEIQNRKDFFQTIARPSLQHLALRQCLIGDEILKVILGQITKFSQEKLKSLDLYGNNLTVQIAEDICSFIEQRKCLQFVGLSKNALNGSEFFTRFFNSIGLVEISAEQYEAHKVKQKARDQIAEKNKKKKKGAPEEPLPFLFEIKETQKAKFYVKNASVKMINLSMNGIKDAEAPLIRKLLEQKAKDIELFLQGNKFSKSIRQTFKFFSNVNI